MVNTRRKGNRTRRETIKILENLGYHVEVLEKTGRFIKIKDVLFSDLIAIKGKEIKFIQCKTNNPGSNELKQMKSFLAAGKCSNPWFYFEIWNKRDRKGFTIKRVYLFKGQVKVTKVSLLEYN